jgi:hypothetical protein
MWRVDNLVSMPNIIEFYEFFVIDDIEISNLIVLVIFKFKINL